MLARRATPDVVADLVEQARTESIGSIDHALNAKAIALSNEKVQAALREVLDRNFQLVAIQPLRGFGSALLSFPLNFVFRPRAESGPVALNESFVVIVELPTRTIKRISKTATPTGSDVPFAIAANAQFEPPRTPASMLAPRRQREAAYFRNIGLGMWSEDNPPNTVTETLEVTQKFSTGCETESDGIADDSAYDDYDEDYSYHPDYGHERGADYPGSGPSPTGPALPGGQFPGGPGGGWPWPDPPPPYGWRYRRR
jgi:hypothetical protein